MTTANRFLSAVRRQTKGDASLESVPAEPSLESLTLPPPMAWPELSVDAYHGLAGEFVELVLPHTEASPECLLLHFLAALGNVVERRPHVQVSATRHYANLFVAIVGDTARARKGTAADCVVEFFRAVDPEWAHHRILDGIASGEALVHQIRDPVTVNGEEVDAGERDKRAWFLESEFARLLAAARRDASTLSAVLRMAWDGKDLRTLSKHHPGRASRPHVSVTAHITMTELRCMLPGFEHRNGFANRFLWALSTSSKLLPDGGQLPHMEALAGDVRLALEAAQDFGRMERSAAARALWESVYVDLHHRKNPGVLDDILARSQAQCLRLSLIYAILDSSRTIEPVHIRAAVAIWNYCEASARIIFGQSTGNPLADRILCLLHGSDAGLSRTEIHAKLGNNVKAPRIVDALAVLRDQGVATLQKVTDSGRTREMWKVRMYELHEFNEGGVSPSHSNAG